jgi:hypothetical protein
VWLIAGILLSTLIVLIARGLQDQARVLRGWQMVLAPWGAEAYQELQRRLEEESQLADLAYSRAFHARAAGSSDSAVRLLEVGGRLVARTSPDIVVLLQEMAALSRMAAAISPVEPLRASDFRLRELSSLALVAGVLHRFLASTAERFWLGTFVLRRGFGLIPRFLLSSTRRIRSKQEAVDGEWDRIAAARADLKILSRESLHTFHTLLLSLAAQERR